MHQMASGDRTAHLSSRIAGVLALILTSCVALLICAGAALPGFGTAVDTSIAAQTTKPAFGTADAFASNVRQAALGDVPAEDRPADTASQPPTDDQQPTAATAVISGQTAVVSWSRPPTATSAPVSHYRVTSTAGRGCITNATTLTCMIPGLANGVVYRFTVTAISTSGEEHPSRPTNGVAVGLALPGTPTNISLMAGVVPGTAVLTWTEPMSSGAAPITAWSIMDSDGNPYPTRPTRSVDAHGIIRLSCVVERSPNEPDLLWVSAVNRYGTGPAAPAAMT